MVKVFKAAFHFRRERATSQPLVFTKYEGSGQTDLYAKALRFSTRMFDDHMSWGYNSLFAGGRFVKGNFDDFDFDVFYGFAQELVISTRQVTDRWISASWRVLSPKEDTVGG